ncbi:MAG: biopolymer transporter ExbD [Kiritimatiellae bacterium]|nr:biopolymer transporter ExbD [Kiritimatiellia bacterium]
MKLITGYENRKARFEMLPLLDIMFLILVFFIYSIFSMSVHKGLKVDLPAAEGALAIGEMNTVTITAENLLFLNKEQMTMEQVATASIANWKLSKVPVLIKADKAASLGTGIELLSKLKVGGVERVAFQVESM